ncbi:MAG TPA: hypothetical protein ACFCUC_17730 [Desulfobacterales bacterium]
MTRSKIIKILKAWENNKATVQEVWKWANEHYFPGETDFDDWEGDNSAANEVLCELDSLDMNLVTQEDIPIHIEFLETPKGKFEIGFQRWQKKIKSIDFKERCKKLRSHRIYGPFCK